MNSNAGFKHPNEAADMDKVVKKLVSFARFRRSKKFLLEERIDGSLSECKTKYHQVYQFLDYFFLNLILEPKRLVSL